MTSARSCGHFCDGSQREVHSLVLAERVVALALPERCDPQLHGCEPLQQLPVCLVRVLGPKPREELAVDLDLNRRSHGRKGKPAHCTLSADMAASGDTPKIASIRSASSLSGRACR